MIGTPLGVSATDQEVVEEQAKLSQQLAKVMDAVAQQGYALLGIEMPVHGLRCSPLLGLDARVDFAGPFLEELQNQAAKIDTAGELSEWVENRISVYGKDARGLVCKGVHEWLNGTSNLTDKTKGLILEVF